MKQPILRNKLIIFSTLSLLTACNFFSEQRVLTQGIEYFPNGLDPAINFAVDEQHIYSQMYETLIELDGDYHTLRPKLATSWEISNDKKTYTFQLRENVHFHNGQLLTAEVVKSSIEHQLRQPLLTTLLSRIDSVNVKSDLEFNLVLKEPFASTLHALASTAIVVFWPEREKENEGETFTHYSGTGPFKLDYIEPGKEIRLISFDKYWGPKNDLARIQFKHYPDRVKREDAIVENDVDLIYAVAGYSIDRLKWIGRIDYYVQQPVSLFFLGFNNAYPPFNNPTVRKAVLHAINIPKLVLNVNRGNATVAKGPLPETYIKYDKQQQTGYDPKESRRLLKLAGYENGLTLNFYFPKVAFVRQTIVEMIKSDLKKINIELDVHYSQSWQEHDQLIRTRDCHLFMDGGKSEIIGDAENFLYGFFYSNSEFNSMNYHNKKVDRWLNEARSEPEIQKRDLLYAQIVEEILKDTPAVFLYHVKPHFAFNREKIRMLKVNPYGIVQYNRIILN